MIGMIVAMDKNRLIAHDGKIPWKRPVDMKRFKSITMGSVLIMGRLTFETLPASKDTTNSFDKLPGRSIWVCSKLSPGKDIPGGIKFAEKQKLPVWIAGGEQIYKLGFEYVDTIDLTIVDTEIEINTKRGTLYFPEIPSNFILKSSIINLEDPTLTHQLWLRKI
jgi:dihydrofolate reductase